MTEDKLTEEDIRRIYGSSEEPHHISYEISDNSQQSPEKYFTSVKRQINGGPVIMALSIIKTLGLFILIFSISFGVLNFPALYLKARYFIEVKQQNKTWVTVPTLNPTPTVATNESFLVIAKIGVNAPIVWNVPGDQTLPALENGVAHYKGTALPGQIGNIFISGHSSYYWWNKGNYKEVFALLEEMNIGDKISINYKGTIYEYVVFDKKVVKPDNIDVLNQPNERILSLMTCVPVGTNLNRLIIIAKQI